MPGTPSPAGVGWIERHHGNERRRLYQLLSFVLVGRALNLVYALNADRIERHGDVHASRIDPGPQLALTTLRDMVFTQEDVFETDWLNEYKWDPYWIENHPEAR